MKYTDAVKYLYSFLNYEVETDYSYRHDLNLKRMAHLMSLLGNPDRKTRFVLVGGTKGKGSTAYLIYSILTRAGHRTGLYTSPHLNTPLERIAAAGRFISQNEFADLFVQIKNRLEARPLPSSLGHLTFFEVLTAAAILYFSMQRVELAVLEVGLGGRLDATNIVTPLVSVLTPVSYDHQDKLGHTLEKIAREKIPIVKDNSCFVAGYQKARVEEIFSAWARRKRSKAFFLGRDFHIEVVSVTKNGSSFDFLCGPEKMKGLYVGLPGHFQVENAACAVQTVKLLNNLFSIAVKEADIREGLQSRDWPGRFQIVRQDPLVILDGAHNGASFRALLESVRMIFPDRKVILILGVSREKDIRRIFKELGRVPPQRLVLTQSKNPRACPPALLRKAAAGLASGKVSETGDLKQAIESVLPILSSKDLVLITGSLFLVAEAKTLFEVSPKRIAVH